MQTSQTPRSVHPLERLGQLTAGPQLPECVRLFPEACPCRAHALMAHLPRAGGVGQRPREVKCDPRALSSLYRAALPRRLIERVFGHVLRDRAVVEGAATPCATTLRRCCRSPRGTPRFGIGLTPAGPVVPRVGPGHADQKGRGVGVASAMRGAAGGCSDQDRCVSG